MAGFSDENASQKFKSGLEAFSEQVQKPKNANENVELNEESFIHSTPNVQNNYGYNITDNQVIQDYTENNENEIPISNSFSWEKHAVSDSSHTSGHMWFGTKSSSRESQYSLDEYIYHDFDKKDGKNHSVHINPMDHDKMAYREKKTNAGGGANFEHKFTDDGKLKAKIFLSKGDERTDNKGFKNKAIQFTDKAEDIFEDIKEEDNEALASFTDSKLETVLMHRSKKHLKKGRRYVEIKGTTKEEIAQLKKEIKAEKKAEERANINSKFNSSNLKFTDDRDDSFSSLVDEKFQSAEKQQRIDEMFSDSGTKTVSSGVEYAEIKKNADKMELFTDDEKINADKQAVKDKVNAIESKFDSRNMTNAEKLEQSKAEKKAASKSENKEVRKAAAIAAVSKIIDAKKNVQNQLGDMSGEVSGDLMKDGSTGVLQTMTNTFKELILGATKKMAAAVGRAVAPAISTILIPICIFFLLLTIIVTVLSAVGGLLGADDGVNYDLDVNGDGYVYTSISEEQIDEIIEKLYENYSDMSATQEAVLRYALDKVGCPYDQDYHGNVNVNIFDCSSLAYRAYRAVGINIANNGAYSAAEECRGMMNNGNTVTGDMKPGDLIFYGGSDNGRYMGIYHVAIYVGRVDGVDKMVEARGVNYGVVYCDVRSNNVVNISRPY